MKILIAPDSFKESMSALEASLQIEEAIHHYDATISTKCIPLADGGEGTLDTLISSMGGRIEEFEVTDVRFRKRKVPIGIVKDTAIIECAKVCGLELLNDNEKDPAQTTTYGLGELILKALDLAVSRILICLGGSATNDGGIGMLSALGVSFLDEHQQSVTLTMAGLQDLKMIDWSHLDQRLKHVHLIGVCDVSNPLCGQQGATYVYGRQKGLQKEDCQQVDQNMHHYAKLVEEHFGRAFHHQAGAGAAGGLGFALLICHGVLQRGFDVVSQMTDLEKAILECDCVIVGEGKMDYQTQYGKTPYGVLLLAQKYHKKVYAFAGKVEDRDVLKKLGFQNVWAITPPSMELSQALKEGKENIKKCVFNHMEDMIHGI